MEKLKSAKECLMGLVQGQMGNLANVDAQELGAVIDMVKDLEEAIYYCTITKAMEGKEHQGHQERYYPIYYRDMDKDYGRMYYDGGRYNMYYGGGNSSGNGSSNGSTSGNSSSGSAYYTEREMPFQMRDVREGRSPISRRTYMESKEMKKGKPAQIHELEKYMDELSHDIVEMIDDASPEEKQMLHKKLSTLTSKIQNLNV